MVRITFERDPRELPALLRALTGVVAWKDWEARVAGLRASSRRNPVWERFVRERYGLELAFGEVRDHLRETGRIPWPPRNAEEARLYAFALAAVGVYARLSNDGKARLAGAIERGLQNVDGLGPLAFELRVAVHLMRRGFDVFFHDPLKLRSNASTFQPILVAKFTVAIFTAWENFFIPSFRKLFRREAGSF